MAEGSGLGIAGSRGVDHAWLVTEGEDMMGQRGQEEASVQKQRSEPMSSRDTEMGEGAPLDEADAGTVRAAGGPGVWRPRWRRAFRDAGHCGQRVKRRGGGGERHPLRSESEGRWGWGQGAGRARRPRRTASMT